MAPKKSAKGLPPAATSAAKPMVKLNGQPTRSARSAANKARQAQRFEEQKKLVKVLTPQLPRNPDGKTVPVIHDGNKPRPTKYTQELADRLCEMFATDSRMSLARVNVDPTLPALLTLYKWFEEHPDFLKAYTHARQIQQDLQAEELADIAHTPRPFVQTTTKTGTGPSGPIDTTEERTVDNTARTQLIIDTQKWILSKMRPKKYGVQPIEVEEGSGLSDLLNQFRARSKELENEPD